ncbi:hypothetical protein EDB80DRAFT_865374 [Ilyonectria destructans]|nr:hypothetical protein EDB80DRAFT_865374 [Ilyonectria destructans]
MNDIHAAIRDGQESLALQHNSIQRARCLFNLGGAFFAKFENTNLSDDLDAAIDMQTEAASDTQSPKRPAYLPDLANKLRDRYFRYRDKVDLDTAVEQSTLAVEILQLDHPRRVRAEASLGGMRFAKFDRTGVEEDLDKSVDHGRATLEHALLADSVEQIYMVNLAESVRQRFDVFGRLEDVQYAITLCETIVGATASNHPRRATRLSGLSKMLYSRYKGLSSPKIWRIASSLGKKLQDASFAPSLRTRAGTALAMQSIHDRDWQKAYDVLQKVIDLLPWVSPRTLARGDQQYALKGFSETASLAASCALQLGKSDAEALEILESGRGIISGLVINERNDVSELELVDNDLAAKYDLLRDRISQLSTEGPEPTTRTEFLPTLTDTSD